MTDYKEKFDDLHRAAKRKARELDEKLNVSGMVEDTARVAGDAARRGAQTIANGAGQLRAEAERIAHDPNLHKNAQRASTEAKRRAKDAGRIIRDAAGDAGRTIPDSAGPDRQDARKGFDEALAYAVSATELA